MTDCGGRVAPPSAHDRNNEGAKVSNMLNLTDRMACGKAEKAAVSFTATSVADERRARSWLDARLHEGRRHQFTEEKPIHITPALAEVMLERNVGNRKLRERLKEKYKRALREGRWLITHQGIAFDKDGVLRDGQHRLTAIAEEGRSAYMVVTFGLDPDSFTVMDTGGARRAGDVLEINGRGGGRDLASTARCIILAKGNNPRHNRQVDNDEIDAFVRDTPALLRFYPAAAHVRGSLKSGAGLIAGLYLISEVATPVKLDEFMEKVRTGVGFTDKRDAALALRNGLVSGTIAARYTTNMAASTVLAWNLWCRGRTARPASLKWESLAFPAVERA